MAHSERPFFSKESIEDKIRKYTKPHPVVTSHLRKYSTNLPPTTFNATSQLAYPSHWQMMQPSCPFFGNSMNDVHHAPPTGPPTSRNSRVSSHPTTTKNNSQQNRKRAHSCSAAIATNHHASYGKHPRKDFFAEGKYFRLTQQVKFYTEDRSQSEDLLDKKLKLCSALLCVIRRQFPSATLHLVGSSCNGFASETSDADFCIMINHERSIDQSNEARCYLKIIERLIEPMESLENLQFICAKVPIVKFKDNISGCECDINVNNVVGIRNTHLLRNYSKLDDRVRPLVMAVKMWAKARKINDASQGTLSSYSLVLMVLHYLQCGCEPPVLPSLQLEYPQYFPADSSVDELVMFEPAHVIPCNNSSNEESVGELLVGFFKYFVEIFDWDLEIMSVRLGGSILKKNQLEFKHQYICIEEPFNLTNTSYSVHEATQYTLIKKEFKRSTDRLREKLSFQCIM